MSLKRSYLNVEEKNSYMVAKAFLQVLEGKRTFENRKTGITLWEDWKKRGMITGPMQKNIKLCSTYLKKFCEELESNLDPKEKKALSRQLQSFDFRMIDTYQLKKIMRDAEDKYKYAVIEREKLMAVMEDISAVRCVGCKDDRNNCAIFKMLDDIVTPCYGEQPNCPYAADLGQLTEEEKKDIERIKKGIESKNLVGKPYCRNEK